MVIEYWSDFSCPFCYIGVTHLKRAIDELGLVEEMSVEMRAFELDRDAPRSCVSKTVERYAGKYGISYERAAEQVAEIEEIAVETGIDMHYTTARATNTFDAHRLLKFARASAPERAEELELALYDAYFTRNLELADHEVLRRIAFELGLDGGGVDELLATDAFADEVRADEREALLRNIRAVPHFVLGDQVLPGCASVERCKAFLGR